MTYKIGILDQSPLLPNGTAYESIQNTISLAKLAEDLGYSRFWVSEHHHSEHVVGSSPEVLISHLLAHTSTINIGSGGVMLQHYSPYKVAENFAVLSAISPNRIDLGIGKAPGGMPLATRALKYGKVNEEDDFEERLRLLQQFVLGKISECHSLFGLEVVPQVQNKPDIFLLGGSVASAKLAAELKINFVFAAFINASQELLEQCSRLYKAIYPEGKLIIALSIIGAPTDEEARQLGEERKIFKVKLENGKTYSLGSEQQAQEFGYQSNQPFEVYEEKATVLTGSPETIKKRLDEYEERYDVDEFIFHTVVSDHAKRIQSYTLLSPKKLKKEERV